MKRVIGPPDPTPFTVPPPPEVEYDHGQELTQLIETVYRDDHLEMPRSRLTEIPYPRPPLYEARIENSVLIEREAVNLRAAIEDLKPRLEELGFDVVFRPVVDGSLYVKRRSYASRRVRPQDLLAAVHAHAGATLLDLSVALYTHEAQTPDGALRGANRLRYHVDKLITGGVLITCFNERGDRAYYTGNQWAEREAALAAIPKDTPLQSTPRR